MPLRVPFRVLLICLVAACAALPERGPPHDLTAADHAQIERAQIEKEEIDRFFDALILESLAKEMPEAWHDLAPELIPGITPEMMLDHQGTAIEAREMLRLIEQIQHPAMPHPMVP